MSAVDWHQPAAGATARVAFGGAIHEARPEGEALRLEDGRLVADKPRQSAEAISAYMLRAEDAAVLS